MKRKRKLPFTGDSVVLDHMISCPHCQEETALGGNYCEHCGGELLRGQRFSEGKICDSCKRINTATSKHCRYCGAKF